VLSEGLLLCIPNRGLDIAAIHIRTAHAHECVDPRLVGSSAIASSGVRRRITAPYLSHV